MPDCILDIISGSRLLWPLNSNYIRFSHSFSRLRYIHIMTSLAWISVSSCIAGIIMGQTTLCRDLVAFKRSMQDCRKILHWRKTALMCLHFVMLLTELINYCCLNLLYVWTQSRSNVWNKLYFILETCQHLLISFTIYNSDVQNVS